MKKILSMALLVCLLMNVLPLGAMATETQSAEELLRAPGSCGDGLTWSYDAGTLTVSGSGEMDDYLDGDAPWLQYKDSITKLVFTGGVSYVGMGAFLDYDALETVEFGSSMHTVGEQAFKSCDGLATIILPASFRCFGKECFMGCENLKAVYCLGGMPSFKGNCLWDTGATVYYPHNNAWPADYVWQLLDSYQYKIQIQGGTPPTQTAADAVAVQATEPAPTQATVPAQTEEATVPETTAAVTEPATEPTQAAEETSATEETTRATAMTEPEWLHETYAQEEPEEEKNGGRGISMGLFVGMCLITAVLSLVLIGVLVFRRRNY